MKSLVYIDAYILDEGESVSRLTSATPGSALAVPDPTAVFDAVPIPNAGGNVDLYVKQALFPGIFAAGVESGRSGVLAAGQRPLAASALTERSGAPAWKSVPSWALIGTADRVIPPAEQEIMTSRAKSRVVRVDAPHLPMVFAPAAVTTVIEAAASASH